MRKETIGPCELYCGDCLEIMPTLPKESVDLFIVDAPYGDNTSYGRNAKEIANNESIKINYDALMGLERLLKPTGTGYYFTNWKFEHPLRTFIEQRGQFDIKMLLCIAKNNFGMGYAFRNQSEYCLVLDKGQGVYNLGNFSNVVPMEHINHSFEAHPHEKGLTLLEKMILHSSSKSEDIILDCFMGSGSTGVAAARAGRKFIGIEIEPKWFDVACKRIEAEFNQGKLF